MSNQTNTQETDPLAGIDALMENARHIPVTAGSQNNPAEAVPVTVIAEQATPGQEVTGIPAEQAVEALKVFRELPITSSHVGATAVENLVLR